jgi:transposase
MHKSKYQEALNSIVLQAHYATATTADERRRWQVLLLLSAGTPPPEIAAATGYRPRTIRQIAQRYAECGAAALVDGRSHGQGAAPILSPEEQAELGRALQDVAPDGEEWTGPKVAQWIAAKTGKAVHRQRGWEYLRRLRQHE